MSFYAQNITKTFFCWNTAFYKNCRLSTFQIVVWASFCRISTFWIVELALFCRLSTFGKWVSVTFSDVFLLHKLFPIWFFPFGRRTSFFLGMTTLLSKQLLCGLMLIRPLPKNSGRVLKSLDIRRAFSKKARKWRQIPRKSVNSCKSSAYNQSCYHSWATVWHCTSMVTFL